MYQYAHDGVTDFESCGFHKNTKMYISPERSIIFFQIKKFINYSSKATTLFCSGGNL